MKTKALWVTGIAVVIAAGCALWGPREVHLQVLDPEGKPAAAAEVFWQEPVSYLVGGDTHVLGVTDADGKISFQRPPGHPSIQACSKLLIGQLRAEDIVSGLNTITLEDSSAWKEIRLPGPKGAP